MAIEGSSANLNSSKVWYDVDFRETKSLGYALRWRRRGELSVNVQKLRSRYAPSHVLSVRDVPYRLSHSHSYGV
jgi:hypothetical protein